MNKLMYALSVSVSLIFSCSIAVAEAIAEKTPPNIEKFDNWGLLCKEEVMEKPSCHIFQNLSAKETKKPILHFAIGFVADHQEPVAVLTLPLGVALRPGVELTIDGEHPARAPFEYCDNVGCRVNMRIPAKSVGIMKKGNEMSVKFGDLKRKTITLPISLKGFTAAYKALDSKR